MAIDWNPIDVDKFITHLLLRIDGLTDELQQEREANATLRRELTHEREDSAVLRRSYSELLGMICQHCYMNIVPKAGEYRFQCPECDLKVRMQG